MFTVKFGYKNPANNDLFEILSADKVVEYNTPAGTYVMLYRYPTSTLNDTGAVVETRIDLGGEFRPQNVFVENLTGKTVQRISSQHKEAE